MATCPLKYSESRLATVAEGEVDCTKEKCAWFMGEHGKPGAGECAMVRMVHKLSDIDHLLEVKMSSRSQ